MPKFSGFCTAVQQLRGPTVITRLVRSCAFFRRSGSSSRACMLSSLAPSVRIGAVVARAAYRASPHRGFSTAIVQQGRPSDLASRPWQGPAVARAAATDSMQEATEQQKGAPVAIITTVGCKFCKKTKEALRKAGIKYDEVEVSRQPSLLSNIKSIVGHTTVPQVFVGGKFVGGSDDTIKLLDAGKLLEQGQGGGSALPQELQQAVEKANKEFEEKQREASVPPDLSMEQFEAAKAVAKDMLAASGQLFALHWAGVRPHRQTAKMSQLLGWLQGRQHSNPLTTLAQLQQAQLLYVVAAPSVAQGAEGDTSLQDLPESARDKVLLRLTAAAPAPKLGKPLNGGQPWFGKARPAEEVAERLRQSILGLYDRHLSEDGKAVDYAALKQDPGFREYAAATSELQKVDLASLNENQRKALFINLYNSIIIHGLTEFGPASNIVTRLVWFAQVKYTIGGLSFSTLDMEHGVLRGNAPSPAAIPVLLGQPQLAKPYFSQDDPRIKLSIPVDPRLHFALVCGAKSCPPIKMYTPDNLEEGLNSAADAVCEGEAEVDAENRQLELSMLFNWYQSDFGGKSGVVDFLLQHTKGQQNNALRELQQQCKPDEIKFEYLPYDWSMNST